ncbi:protein TRC8 homolog isoform X1 [Metopolophium dirhodum]|uniref:protein TRC8 homolog isoform X1 n=1 Tax=Metopolophium dirhodum TaxID=44670 RepID=UPI00298F4CC4|nr:protein TRC8 homolog isoform X1 [Metopolophium dirhodum]
MSTIMSLCVFLRTPPLFIIDKIFNISFGFQDIDGVIITLYNTFGNSIHNKFENGDPVQYIVPILLLFYLFIKIIATCLVFCLLLCIFVLPARHLYKVYLHVAPICVVILSCWVNMQTLNVISKQYVNFNMDIMNKVITWDVDVIIRFFTQLKIVNFLCLLFCNLMLQFGLSLVFNFLQVCATNHSIHKVVYISFIIPTLMALITATHSNTLTMLLLSLLPLFIVPKTCWLNILTIMKLIYYGYKHIRATINIYDFVVMEWSRLNMPSVLRLFWAIRLLDLFILSLLNKEIKHETLFGSMKYLLIKGSDTSTAVLGMTSFVSYFCHFIIAFFRWVLTENVEQMNIRQRSAILFFVLALQTGLTALEPDERFVQLCINISITCDFLMFYIHGSMIDPLLSSLSVNRNKSINRHLRGLLVSGFLIMFSINVLRYLWYYNFLNNWKLEISCINLQFIVRMLVTLGVYSLYMIDGYHKTIWEKLDDYEFYIKSSGDVANFCLSTSIFLNGIYNLAFESASIASLPLMCLHAYYAIWRSIRDGWRVLIRRRLAIRRVESLADATNVQLSEFDDICSICRHNMDSAKITNCNHYFHSICLRKWLNLKDNCPLCHDVLYQA